MIFFMHIDKTGGMTVRELLAAHYKFSAIKPVPHNPYASEKHLNYPLAAPDLMLANRMFRMNYRPEYKLVMGHYDWSVLQYLDDPIIMTVLREPVTWFMSLYRYICQETAMYGDLAEKARAEGPLRFAHDLPRSWMNAQTSQLAGIRWTGSGIVGEEGYHTASENLERCHYVGITQALNDFIADVHQGMGWPLPDIPKRNVTRFQAECTPEIEAYIHEHSPYDFLLFEQARARCNITPA